LEGQRTGHFETRPTAVGRDWLLLPKVNKQIAALLGPPTATSQTQQTQRRRGSSLDPAFDFATLRLCDTTRSGTRRHDLRPSDKTDNRDILDICDTRFSSILL
jgi:hypothetical protein